MPETEVHGPIDFVLLEFTGDRLTGRAAEEVVSLMERGIIHVYDVMIVGKDADGAVYAVDLAESSDRVGGFAELDGARTGLLADDDLNEAAGAMQPGTLAALIVYENTWAIPFVAAAMESGGTLIAGGRIPAEDVMEALDAMETVEAT
ncbi:hypothetical protein EV644_113150 [Kribbella orskensis]|uniref:DUF1269 domain-containing protein n=1 Tax=Kribbella orskensis TaxID=2512216 RepID=A0ABY2BEK7_9ACTN|nr:MULTISPECIES: DUF6325 family protein [Kribbella]TCN36681.1 hypothetical protein EV642_114149 [Kribbella sp. VKM Ac-2500]TCO17920.1 hypothetical protein EV644_113150 [Kribbella orskensis]